MKQPIRLVNKNFVLKTIDESSRFYIGLGFGKRSYYEVRSIIATLSPCIIGSELLHLSTVCEKLHGCRSPKLSGDANRTLEHIIKQSKKESFFNTDIKNLIMKTPLRSPNTKIAVDTADVLQENGNYARFYWAKEESDKGWQFLSFVDLHDFTIIDEANLSDYVIEAVNSVKQLDPDDLAYVTDEVLNYLKKRNEVIFSYCFEVNGNVRGGIIVYNENDMETPLRLKQTLKDELVHGSNTK